MFCKLSLLQQRHPALRHKIVADQRPSVACGRRWKRDAVAHRVAGDAQRDARVVQSSGSYQHLIVATDVELALLVPERFTVVVQ